MNENEVITCHRHQSKTRGVTFNNAADYRAALVSGLEAGGLQDSHLGLPFIVRHDSG